MSTYYKIWLVISCLFILIITFWGIKHPYWGDESHFVETIKLFTSSSWTVVLKDYPEVTTPLVYLIYSVWGKLFGTGLITLRILSLIISFSFLIILFHYFRSYIKNERIVLILCIIVLINPYIWGLSIFVFTDMSTLLLIFTALYLFKKDKLLLTSFFLGLSLLCRQYAAIFIISVWLFLLIKSLSSSSYTALLRFTLYQFIFSLPFIYLILLWKGLSPPSGIEKFIPYTGIYWNPHALVTYITFSAVYIIPLILLLSKKLLSYKGFLIPAFILGCICFLFSVEVSTVTRIQTNLDTVGLAHKLLYLLTGRGILSDLILYLFFSLGIWIIIIFLKEDIKTLKKRKIPYSLLLSVIFYIFLLIMPLSYQVWEKYLLLIIPVILLRLGYIFPEYSEKSSELNIASD